MPLQDYMSVPAGPTPTQVQLDYWHAHQAYWAISPLTGNDINEGWGDTLSQAESRPLKTHAEFLRRMKGARISDICVVRIMDDVNENVRIDDIFPTSTVSVDTGQEGTLLYLGKATVLHSGTLTAVTPQDGNTRGTVSDSALPVSWTASGCIGTLERGTCIRTTDLQKHAWILADRGSKTIQIATPTNTAFEVVDQQTSTVRSDFIVGDHYEVVTYSKLGTVRVGEDIYVRLQGLTVGGTALGGSTAVHPASQAAMLATGCWFGYAALLGPGQLGAVNCGFANTGMTLSGGVLANCAFVNDGTGGTVLNDTHWNCQGVQTLYRMNYLWFKGRRSGLDYVETGNNVELAIWDCADEIIYLDNGVECRIDVLTGDGNLGSIVSVGTGCSVRTCSRHFAGNWIALGVGKPVKFGNESLFDYDELPVQEAARGKAVYGLQ